MGSFGILWVAMSCYGCESGFLWFADVHGGVIVGPTSFT